MWAIFKVRYRILFRVFVKSSLACSIFQLISTLINRKDVVYLLFVVCRDLYWRWRVVYLYWQQVVYILPKSVW
jgi:hypothetical protein